MTEVDALALGEATCTAIALAAIVGGRRAIRQGDRTGHRSRMLIGAAASACFLALFVVRFVRFGPTPFDGSGVARGFFLAVYFTHEPLAVANVVLVIAALLLAWRGSFRWHREVASLAYPVWLFVTVTGLVLWALLYAPRLL